MCNAVLLHQSERKREMNEWLTVQWTVSAQYLGNQYALGQPCQLCQPCHPAIQNRWVIKTITIIKLILAIICIWHRKWEQSDYTLCTEAISTNGENFKCYGKLVNIVKCLPTKMECMSKRFSCLFGTLYVFRHRVPI